MDDLLKDARTHREPKFPFFGFAPGGYLIRCKDCGEQVHGTDKRAYRCLPCAMDFASTMVCEQPTAPAKIGFKDWYRARYGDYPGYRGEDSIRVTMRVLDAVDEVVSK